jgi:8-hydroxy-5-deazaflavin:NADPH oxidoreductase
MASIALIGPGRHGTAIARLFAAHGVGVTRFHHRPQKAAGALAAVRAVARGAEVRTAATIREAVADHELVVLTTLWDAPQRSVIGELGDELVGRILLDVSNPLDVTPAGIIPRRPAQGSAGQFVATLLPTGAGHAKAFSNLPTAAIESDADHDPLAVLPFAADFARTADRVRPYLDVIGWQPWLVGDISRSADLEIGGRFNSAVGRWGRARLDAAEMGRLAGSEAALADRRASSAFGAAASGLSASQR